MRNSKFKIQNSSGQSLFETVLAIAIVVMILTALAALATTAVRNAAFSKNKTLSTRLAQEATEWLRGERDKDWDFFTTKAMVPKWCLASLSWTEAKIGSCGEGDIVGNTVFKREVIFVPDILDPDTIEARVEVSWSDSQGSHQTRASTYFTNWMSQ